MKNYLALLAALFALSGQAPAPNSAAVPVRRLDYAFSIYPNLGNGGGRGTLHVAVLGRASDGGLLIQGTDDWDLPWGRDREHQTIACEVYDSGTVTCPDDEVGLSPMQRSLFPLLATGFFTDGNEQRFQIVDRGPLGVLTTMSDTKLVTSQTSNPDRLAVDLDQRVDWKATSVTVPFATARANVIYDRQSAVPVSLHESWNDLHNPNLHDSYTLEMKLTGDSRTSGG
jgi:hypothetical protein